MRRALVLALLALSACSLVTSLDGFSGGGGTDDGGREGSAQNDGGDGATDGAPGTDSGDAGEAGPDRSQLYALAVLSDKPRGYWRLEEIAGVAAKGENGRYDGVYVESPGLGAPGAAGSRAMKLSKDTQARMRVDSPDFRFPGNSAYTVELWAKAGELKDYQWLGGTETAGGGRSGWSLLGDANGAIRYEVWNPDGDGGSTQVRGLSITATGLTPGGFHHIVMAYGGTSVIGYIDGVRTVVFPTAGVVPDSGHLLVWGCRGDLAGCLDDWTIDELAIYDFQLDQTRVEAHYDLGK